VILRRRAGVGGGFAGCTRRVPAAKAERARPSRWRRPSRHRSSRRSPKKDQKKGGRGGIVESSTQNTSPISAPGNNRASPGRWFDASFPHQGGDKVKKGRRPPLFLPIRRIVVSLADLVGCGLPAHQGRSPPLRCAPRRIWVARAERALPAGFEETPSPPRREGARVRPEIWTAMLTHP